MPEAWYRCFLRLLNELYFARITVIHPERIPRTGPVLYLGLHRNGAVDGFVYYQALRQPVFLISTQLRRSWFARLFFNGISVARTKDESEQSGNEEALGQCVQHLRSGGSLCVFPEGTSSLGPRHLPFKGGASWLILDYLERGAPPLQVIPVGIHYECPWSFRAKVEVVIGEALSTEMPAGASRLQHLKEMRRRMETGLARVGINVPSAEYLGQIERLAYASTLATDRSYFASLKAFETSIPSEIQTDAANLDSAIRDARLLYHQGVPLFPMGSFPLYCLALVVLAPIVLAAILLNLPPFLSAAIAARKLPDDRNVISLWKILVGAPVSALWAIFICLAAIWLGKPLLLGAYATVTWLGVLLYYRVKKLAVAVLNGLRYPGLRPRMLAFRESIISRLPSEGAPPENRFHEPIPTK